jgi:competence protein ComEC
MGIILVAGMLIIGFSFVPVMASFITAVTVWLVAVFNQLVFGLKQFNPASFYYANLEFYELLLVYAIVISGSVYFLKKKKGALFPVLSFVCLLLVSFCFNEWKALHQQKLVVYNISKANHIELINGKQYQIIATDTTISQKTKNYSLKPAHTGWHAWRQKTADRHELFYIGGHSVLVLNGGAEYDAQFPVDYLVLNYKARKGDVLKLAHTFQPKKIIMGANISRKRTEEWIQASKQAGIPVHAAGLQGAFVLDAFEALP